MINNLLINQELGRRNRREKNQDESSKTENSENFSRRAAVVLLSTDDYLLTTKLLGRMLKKQHEISWQIRKDPPNKLFSLT